MPMQSAPICAEEGSHTLRLVHSTDEWVDIDGISVIEPVEYNYYYFFPMFL